MTTRTFLVALVVLTWLGLQPLASFFPAPAGGPRGGSGSSAICDTETPLTLVGLDSAAGTVLLSIAPLGQGSPAHLVALDASLGAKVYANPTRGRLGGSVGPGPIAALEPCGTRCLQPVRFEDGRWLPLGERILAPAGTASTAYDRSGTPWAVLLAEDLALAYRLAGREWKERGSLPVFAVGHPALLADPESKDGAVCGTVRFSASKPPAVWAAGLPALNGTGQLRSLGQGAAAFVSEDGSVFRSSDGGKTWKKASWLPWETKSDARPPRLGKDYSLDLAAGDLPGALPVVWYDVRNPADERIVLSLLDARGQWRRLAEARSRLTTRGEETVEISEVIALSANRWLLLSGCIATAEGSSLVVRVFDGREISAPKMVPLSVQP